MNTNSRMKKTSIRVLFGVMTTRSLPTTQIILSILASAGMALSGVNAESLDNYQVTDFLKGDAKNQRFSHRFGYHGRIYRESLLNRSKQSESTQRLESLSIVSDWFPGKGQFRITAGLLYQESSRKNQPNHSSWNIAEQVNVSNLSIHSDEQGLAPYVGLGWNHGSGVGRRLGLNVDVGVLYQPDRSLYNNSDSSLYNGRTSTLLKDFEELELTPTFSLGLSYSF